MSIKRASRPDNNFYVLDNRIIEDSRLSWDARAVLVYLLTKPDDWQVSITHLAQQTSSAPIKTGVKAVYRIINELIEAGYVTRSLVRRDDGRVERTDYVVSESPHAGEPYAGEPHTPEPHAGERHAANEKQPRTDGNQERRGTKNGIERSSDGATRQGADEPRPTTDPDAGADEAFESFWQTCRRCWYGAPGNKQRARKAFHRAVEDAQTLEGLALQDATRRRTRHQQGGFAPLMKHVEGWLNNRCWEDELGDAPGDSDDDPVDPTDGGWI